ncbi:hypothetical protein GCK72_004249 [Caenorhabditis remanei]|uniref:Uncharacterized protein n=1 Tax=Caenorhabditis remanei TaxID=31234 RepID=A0A6A5HD45_CAERE|nr:hypothetical protein GCK72_004249 [Caenorhabditis remanei]KAF1764302.1 hypothetical protein GCK72_004249 [Caenorhabditis remanei]
MMDSFHPPLILLLLLMLLISIPTAFARRSHRNALVEIPDKAMLNGTVYVISPLMPKVFVETGEFTINSSQCLHYSFNMTENRVK